MSWAEDNGFDMFDMWDIPSYWYNEEHWQQGVHFDRNNNVHMIKEMSDDHLINTIKLFSDSNTKPLKDELNRRHVERFDMNPEDIPF